jgi:hypothetical protein
MISFLEKKYLYMKNIKKSCFLFLGFGVFCAGVFAGGSSVGYREIFPNDKGVDWPLEETGWRVHVGNTAAPLESDAVRVSWVNGRTGNLEAVGSFPANKETLRGFLFIHNLGGSQLIWTDEVDLEIPADRRMEISWYQNTDGTDAAQLAVRIDGAWYVSSRKFGDGKEYTKMSVRFADGAWQKLDFTENRELAPGPAAELTGKRLDAVGFYVPNCTAKMRIDTVEVRLGELTPEIAASEELLQGFVLPPVNFSPGAEYGPSVRNYQGIPGIESAPGGRLWATWYAGPVWEDRFNYMLVATSGDAGEHWTDVSFVIDPDGTGTKRVADPCLWLDPDGKLWLFFWLNGDGLTVTMAMTTENPDDENPVWTEPRALFSGVMLNKPIVTSKDEWLMPSAMWNRDGSCRVMVSTDRGKTFSLRGTATIPPDRRNCDEEMIVERSDGSLFMLVRTANYGIGASVSTDGGNTWTEVSDYQKHTTSRFVLLKLQSGNLLLVRNGPLDVRAGRDNMTAFLSDDDGATWKGGLLLDERGTSYPDATQASDGTIYAIYDQDRGGEKRILMAAFTEQDILAGEFRSPKARAKVLINRATGVNPSRGRIGADPKPRTDPAAAALITSGPRAALNPVNGKINSLPRGANYAFTDSDYISKMAIGLDRVLPSVKAFVFSSMERTEAVCTQPGMAYVLTPSPDRNPDSVEADLLAQGFEKTSAAELDVLLKTQEQARSENLCCIYQKKLSAGEKVTFGKWGVLVF